jgi:hypothetical protein
MVRDTGSIVDRGFLTRGERALEIELLSAVLDAVVSMRSATCMCALRGHVT